MKKRNVLLIFGLCAMLALTGCAGSDSGRDDDDRYEEEEEEEEEEPTLEGEWVATWDISEEYGQVFMDSLEGSGLEEYMDISGWEIEVKLTLEEDEFEFEFTEDSIDEFLNKITNATIIAMDTYVEEMAASNGMTADEVYAALDMTKDEFNAMMLEEMDLESLKAEMVFEMKGDLEYDDDTLTLTNEDGETEEWEYELDGDELTIIMDMDGEEVELEFERQ